MKPAVITVLKEAAGYAADEQPGFHIVRHPEKKVVACVIRCISPEWTETIYNQLLAELKSFPFVE